MNMKKTQLKKVFLWLFLALPFLVFSQATVSGYIQDELDGTPLPGVDIVIKGTTTGTTSDFDGNYEITVNDFPATLVFSSLGFETREIRVTDKT
jgi:hypothetical protein